MVNVVIVWNPGGYFCRGSLRFIRIWAVLVLAVAFFTCSVEGLLSCARSVRFYASTILQSLPSIVETALKDPLRCGLSVSPNEITTTTLLVLISGGCDSTALLHALSIAKDRFTPPLRLHAATFDHSFSVADINEVNRRIREESAGEVVFVKEFSESLEIPCHTAQWNNNEKVKNTKAGLQSNARDWRMHEASKIADRVGAAAVLVAHHQDDNDETIMLKLLRGVHLTEIQGMKWVSECTVNPSHHFKVMRPFLDTPKDVLKAYLKEKGLSWLEDASNFEREKYKRNEVRLELLPVVHSLSGGKKSFHRRLTNLARQASLAREMSVAEANAWEKQYFDVQRPWELPLAPLLHSNLPRLVQERILYRFILVQDGERSGSLSYDKIWRLADRLENEGPVGVGIRSWTMQLGGGFAVVRKGSVLWSRRGNKVADGEAGFSSLVRKTFPTVTVVAPKGWSVQAIRDGEMSSVDEAEDREENKGGMLLHNVSCDEEIVLRRPKRGDKVQWSAEGVKRSISVKRMLRHRKIPLHLRENTVLVEGTEGRVLGIYPGICIPEAAFSSGGGIPAPLRLQVVRSDLLGSPVLHEVHTVKE